MVQLSGQRFLVTGGGGFIGRYVVQRLLARGPRCACSTSPGRGPFAGQAGVEVMEGDRQPTCSGRWTGSPASSTWPCWPSTPPPRTPPLSRSQRGRVVQRLRRRASGGGAEGGLLVRLLGLRGHPGGDGRGAPAPGAHRLRGLQDRRGGPPAGAGEHLRAALRHAALHERLRALHGLRAGALGAAADRRRAAPGDQRGRLAVLRLRLRGRRRRGHGAGDGGGRLGRDAQRRQRGGRRCGTSSSPSWR